MEETYVVQKSQVRESEMIEGGAQRKFISTKNETAGKGIGAGR